MDVRSVSGVMEADKFFEEIAEQSEIKARIVDKYFGAWAGIIGHTQNRVRHGEEHRLAYVDLFAGPGRYKDGSDSTPLRVLKTALGQEMFRERLVTLFNDGDPTNTSSLRRAIDGLPDVSKLRHAPKVMTSDVGSEIAQRFEEFRLIPTLAFVDPWGYKGLTLRLVNAFLKNWGCDCIFFFNYARINAGLNNDRVKVHMDALFGEQRAAALRTELEGMSPAQREQTIVAALAAAFQAEGHRFVLPFTFKNKTGARTSHHLILVTKHFKGYEVMKRIMHDSSTTQSQGVASFSFVPANTLKGGLLFDLDRPRPLDDLRTMLPGAFAGRTLTMRELYEEHSVDRPYIDTHYKEVLREFENAGTIRVGGRKVSKTGKPLMSGFANDLRVTFPPRR